VCFAPVIGMGCCIHAPKVHVAKVISIENQ
jgi:hypothetical protein